MSYTPSNNTDFTDALKYYFGETTTLPGGSNVTPATVGKFSNGTRIRIGTWVTGAVTNMSFAFSVYTNPTRTGFNEDISGWDTSGVTAMTSMFAGQTSFNQDLNSWNVINVSDASSMFYKASSFNGDISGWTTAGMTTMEQMFQEATDFNADISGWNVSAVTNFAQMFYAARAFNRDITGWEVGSATTMRYMFAEANAFDQDVRKWPVGNTVTLSFMFQGATAMITSYSGADGFGTPTDYTPSYTFFNQPSPGPGPGPSPTPQPDTRVIYTYDMPFKNEYIPQSSFALGRNMFRRTGGGRGTVGSKPFKTQNGSRDSFRRITAVNTLAARSSLTANGVVPVFKNVDPNYVDRQLTLVRRRGAGVPRNANPWD